ncbi:WhiB family transcriptional regulator [Saccharopolyspora sp. NFXS83]|uniref:WhiB family transcriptional regulator n=1 Tax=Saccharopolyspora sp. NFXS83 TaxID=2993560 RepID=UPI00224B163B|nr:WhiB family transcriptional regulator [Saccharopolyspora sp. NFXS83]MCX2731791.1 WhiB family transcriptional regulator [Saccharopolyspora sp. NFXS83]
MRLIDATSPGRVEVPDWHRSALCAQTDPDAFFPEKGRTAHLAKRICASCEVREDCLRYALEHGETAGIWGGLNEAERRELRTATRTRAA